MLTPEKLAKRRFDLANNIANQRISGHEVDPNFVEAMRQIMENLEDDEALLALDELKQRVIRGEIL